MQQYNNVGKFLKNLKQLENLKIFGNFQHFQKIIAVHIIIISL